MDEQRLRDLLHDAPGETPSSTFDIAEVRQASHRAKRRRRYAVLASCACAVLVLAGAGVLGIMMTTDGTSQVMASKAEGGTGQDAKQQNRVPAEPTAPGKRSPGAASEEGFPGRSPKQGGDGAVESGPRADSTNGCDKVDRELANALADELPATGITAKDCAPQGHAVTIHPSGGRVTATVIDDKLPNSYRGPPGAVTVTRQTAGGGTLMLVSIPDENADAAPLASELKRIATELAARF